MIVDLVTPPLSPLLVAVPTVTPTAQVERCFIALGDMVDFCIEESAVMHLHSPVLVGNVSSCAFVDPQPVPVPASPSPSDTTELCTAIDSDIPEPNAILEELRDTKGDLAIEPVTMAQFKLQHSKLEGLICEHQKQLCGPKVMLSGQSVANFVLELEYLWVFNNSRFELQMKLQKQKDAIANAPP